jgi:ApaG protein
MYSAVTNDIRVAVEPTYSPERSKPEEGLHFWLYTIEIVNLSRRTVQLTHRHWIITDANGRRQEVRGVGVLGEQPTIAPGQSFRYTSGCPLGESSGVMEGAYRLIADDGDVFEVAVPAFSLDIPAAPRVLN